MSEQPPEYVALTRVTTEDGVGYSEGIVVPADTITDTTEWEEAHRHAVDSWITVLRPPGSLATEADRIDEMLRELGWERTDSRRAQMLSVRRVETRFHTATVIQNGRSIILVMNDEGAIVDSIPDLGSAEKSLLANGWRTHGPLEQWPAETLRVSAFDWSQILRRLRGEQLRKQTEAHEQERTLRQAIREAITAGVQPSTIAEATNLSRQRIYQIRDKRR